jgi:prepilin-type N-terminal cleavage/methylation domain-containing protein
MKTHPARTSFAFTLIELITVIAIISVLMALLFPHLASARDSARRQTAATVVRNVVNACNSYKQDYGKYPPVVAAIDSTSNTNPYMSFGDSEAHCRANNNALLDILRSIDRGENASFKLNPKQTKYYEGKKATDARNPRDGFQDGSEFTDTTKAGELMDPWGAQYCFILETDGDEVLDVSTFYSDLSNTQDRVRFAAVGICLGKDGKLGGKGYEGKLRKEKSTEAPDDIVSWQ